MRSKICFAFLLFFTSAAWGQFTLVTGTVVDPNGLPYALGTISSQIVTAGTSPTLNGGGFSMSAGPVGLDTKGHFTLRLADSNVITPHLPWRFTVSSGSGSVPQASGTGTQTFNVTITITGTTQDISTQLNAQALALTVIAAGAGTLQNVATGAGLQGGPCTVTCTISIATGSVTNGMLANSTITLNGTANQISSPGPTALGGTAAFGLTSPMIPPGDAQLNTGNSLSWLLTGTPNLNLSSDAASGVLDVGTGGGQGDTTGSVKAASFIGSGAGAGAIVLKPGNGTCSAPTALFGMVCNNTGNGIVQISHSGSSYLPAVNAATPPLTNTSGVMSCLSCERVANQSIATQSVGSGGNTVYVTNSNILISANTVRAGTHLNYHMALQKSAAGTAASSIVIYVGPNATTGDTAAVTQSMSTETAAGDVAWVDIMLTNNVATATCTTTCTVQWTMRIAHNSATGVGFGNSVVNQGTFTFDSTANTNFGLGVISGASDVLTIDQIVSLLANI